jgi:hypothetical protein
MYKAIEALIVLHNICINWGDHPEDTWACDPQDDSQSGNLEDDVDPVGDEIMGRDADVPGHETAEWLKTQGRMKRQIIMDELFPV